MTDTRYEEYSKYEIPKLVETLKAGIRNNDYIEKNDPRRHRFVPYQNTQLNKGCIRCPYPQYHQMHLGRAIRATPKA